MSYNPPYLSPKTTKFTLNFIIKSRKFHFRRPLMENDYTQYKQTLQDTIKCT